MSMIESNNSSFISPTMIKSQSNLDMLQTHINQNYVGTYMIVRTFASGVHFGNVKMYDPQTHHVILNSNRCIWSWSGTFTLLEISQNGVMGDGREGKLTISVPEILISDVLELIPVNEETKKQLIELEAHMTPK